MTRIAKTTTGLLFALVFMLTCGSLQCQVSDASGLIDSLLMANKDRFKAVVEDPGSYKVQILYTQIDRNASNRPFFTSHSYRLDPQSYFYPASTIKLFAAALALEKIKVLNLEGLSKYTRLSIDSSYSGQTQVRIDSTAPGLEPSIGHYIRKMLVISDNDAYNRLYEFIGQKSLNQNLQEKGFESTMLTHRLSLPLSHEQNKHTNAFHFFDESGAEIYFQEPGYNDLAQDFDENRKLGEAHVQGNKTLKKPMDFSRKNASSLSDLQAALQEIIFPGALRGQPLFDLTEVDYEFLRQYLSQLPRETRYPDYAGKPDNYCKFFLYGDDNAARIPQHIRIFNKIGLAYGFTLDNAYIVDFKNQVEFLLTAVIYTNQNKILNDGLYEYEKTGFPFLAELGRIIFEYELQRKRIHPPDLSSLKFAYDKS